MYYRKCFSEEEGVDECLQKIFSVKKKIANEKYFR